MKTVIHSYNFDIRTKDGAAAYAELRDKLTALGLRCFESHGNGSHYMPDVDGREIELETKHLFDNQWNTAPIPGVTEKGLRVFDWALDAISNIGAPRGIKRGHWLEQTAEMREIRRNTVKCGYCGRQEPAQKGYVFCPHCLDSEYLAENDLHLTRMLPIDDTRDRAPLTEPERAHLLPLYRDAQLHGVTERGKARIAAARARVESDYKKTIASAEEKRRAATWILDRFPALIDNWLFYEHTGRHCFGWRKPLAGETLSALLDAVSEFPFSYEIKCADGRTLSN
jgi:hypothetical protein